MTSESCGALLPRLRGEFVQAFSEYAVEGWKRVDDVGERLQRNAQLDREHELAHDLARARSDQHRADQHPVLAVADEFERRHRSHAFGNLGEVNSHSTR